MEHRFVVSSSPHIHAQESISSIMLDVLIALVPAALAGVYYFGYRSALVMLTTMAAAVLAEYLYEKCMKKPVTTRDLSALVTGLLLGMNLPATLPLWMAAAGSVFAIVIVKQLYGGLGRNFMNPALAARCFMLIAWAGAMTTFSEPLAGVDAISSATPLAVLKGTSEGSLPTLKQAFFGAMPGSIGETSCLMLLLGFLYLLIRRVVDWKIPVTYLVSFALLTFLFGHNAAGMDQLSYTLLQLMSGGLLLGAFFMATDYVTTPTTPLGHIIFGLGCGVLTFVIRQFGGYPEGVSFSILLMNVCAPLIDRYTVPKKFGEVRKHA